MKHLSVILVCILILTACSKPAPLDQDAQFKTINSNGWAYGDTIEFDIAPDFKDSIGTADLAVVVRHTDAYKYSNLWLEVTTSVSGTDSLQSDTINITLADSYGKWLGRGNGVSFSTTDTLPHRIDYDNNHPVQIRHIMRVDTLENIEQIGIIYFNAKP